MNDDPTLRLPAGPPPGPDGRTPPRRRRRRLPVGAGAVLAGAVVGGGIAAAAVSGGTATAATPSSSSPAAPPGPGHAGPATGHHGPAAGLRGKLGELRHDKCMIGTIAAVGAGTLTVTPDGSHTAVPVATSDATRVIGAGHGNRAPSALTTGERVVVFVGDDGKAALVRVTHAAVEGTVAALSGNDATVTRPDGLTQRVDLGKLATKPALGDLVRVSGAPSADGATLIADTLTQLPRG